MKRHIFVILTRKNIIRIAVAFVLVIWAAKFGLYGISACLATADSLKTRKIVIDPGHGGIDGGANCSDFLEKEVNLAVAKKLRDELNKLGAKVILTREDDIDLGQLNIIGSTRHERGLNARVSVIEKNRADVFLSIHVDANLRKPSTSGSIVFYSKTVPSSAKLSKALQYHLNTVLKRHDLKKHTPQTAEFYILRNCSRTGAIIELGFMTNPREKELLKQDKYQSELVKGIVEGLKEYFTLP